ncbi:hypothetical protein COCC4DRAFT_62952 [Bipolaris maydis ATCC 48331]|uniref:Uncharacterized protein n=2 Tax=Cochliobolus heterostrophus TaxID=5016 RepID=M2UFP8_COCH5|nr:uncharacterized protein COCC4DRAFT_62952 [Bipolaris maydis ATCC 48331]EMD86752.1 hypothetical protein COCHEDRAFT_1115209 [Bipolaris maydis C5]ENI03144.1 hypothetical protein COCC4DRAFT_62952 [Bipolaris maydis ATCC 48331]KAJ6203675.1 hypothetical protein PSV09DRAFT_1115209 [Bipolaris maydis]
MDLEESIADIRDAIKQCTDSDLGWIIRNLGPKDLLAVYLITDNVDVQRNLLTQGPVKSVSNMLDILSYHEKAEVLKYMCNERRLGVVGTWCKEKKSKELQRLDKWQLQEDNAWRWGLADTRVWTHGMDKRLPGHYPVNMNRCAMCKQIYSNWDSISILDCRKHSYCESCDKDQSHCQSCDIQ